MNKDQRDLSESDLPVGIGRPATNALTLVGLTRLEHLTEVTEAEVLKLHGVGPKAIRILRLELDQRGLAFKDSKPGNGE